MLKRAAQPFLKPLYCSALLLGCSVASAAMVTHQFTAQVEFVDARLGAAVAVGQTVQGSYQFESSTTDAAGDPTVGLYFNAGSLPALSVGALSWVGSQLDISVSNLAAVDIFRVDASSLSGSPIVTSATWLLDALALTLTDNALASALGSDALPLTPPALAGFNIRGLNLNFLNAAGEPAAIQARVTTLNLPTQVVPVPGTAALVVTGVGLLALRRRRHPEGSASGR